MCAIPYDSSVDFIAEKYPVLESIVPAEAITRLSNLSVEIDDYPDYLEFDVVNPLLESSRHLQSLPPAFILAALILMRIEGEMFFPLYLRAEGIYLCIPACRR
ncbi:hypothetical protein AVEN_93578-1 [Araneus ventricosus]|uniref:Uncharacterized protein n=1 Tax=Araneus ventricosus TaxID=182803 RepID=A0A4Y2ARG0_ARAVE|nr:hypothetical protein AVEN_93578-1 [Araneus ventricosus]